MGSSLKYASGVGDSVTYWVRERSLVFFKIAKRIQQDDSFKYKKRFLWMRFLGSQFLMAKN